MNNAHWLRMRAYGIALYAALIVMSILLPPTRIALLGDHPTIRSLLFALPFLALVTLADKYGISLLTQMIRIGYLLLLFTLVMGLAAAHALYTVLLVRALVGIVVGLALAHLAVLAICLFRRDERSLTLRLFRFVVAPLAAFYLIATFVLVSAPILLTSSAEGNVLVVSLWNIIASLFTLSVYLRLEKK